MIFGLPFDTFFWVFGLPAIAIILALIYGITFKDDNSWWTIDDLWARGNNEESAKEDTIHE